ncbi:MAG: DnaD domain protein [Christensenellaceae bacterium]|nr:DnaD domain protein [Christensenellaceae bacterium]
MAFVSYSRGMVNSNYTMISNIFLNEHLPTSNGDCVRVYLYGLMLCNNSIGSENTIENVSLTLGLSVEDVKSAFEFWEGQGLVQFVNDEVKYLPIRNNSSKVKNLPTGKYDDFNAKAQAILDGRMITTTEFHEYYAFMESMHFEPDALLLVIKNCAELKGYTVGYAYILTVAKNLAYLGLRTVGGVSAKFEAGKANRTELERLIKELRKRQTQPNKQNFIKHDYDIEKIKEIAKCKEDTF